MTILARLTTEIGLSLTFKLTVDAECGSQSLLMYKVFLFSRGN